ncbi:hypothetical protein JDV02_000594 [Purpureocillium takamizusanense]|uniref:Uncharacterized protein n=1 Tax=Purpureocillium takamizusanense TaxID=2060973 RepID=A0A9Q8Q560_9HYPO|nr:uncharacterized protein JDV02_000594 [Purpureocillium takamizusanense]UNI13899.1 hypothetical protein JDV02_000594 [Purpureocillium takamizusanense]
MAEYPETEGRTAEERQWFADLRSAWNEVGDQLTHEDKVVWFGLLKKITANKETLPSKHLVGGRAKRDGNWFSWLFLRTMFGYEQVHHLKAAEMTARANPRTSLEFDMLPHGYVRRFTHDGGVSAVAQTSAAPRRRRCSQPVEDQQVDAITVAVSPEMVSARTMQQHNEQPARYRMRTPESTKLPAAQQSSPALRTSIRFVFNGSEVGLEEFMTEAKVGALMQRVEKTLDRQHQEILREIRQVGNKSDQQYREVLRLVAQMQSEQLRVGEANDAQLGRIHSAVRGLTACLEGCGTSSNSV